MLVLRDHLIDDGIHIDIELTTALEIPVRVHGYEQRIQRLLIILEITENLRNVQKYRSRVVSVLLHRN